MVNDGNQIGNFGLEEKSIDEKKAAITKKLKKKCNAVMLCLRVQRLSLPKHVCGNNYDEQSSGERNSIF